MNYNLQRLHKIEYLLLPEYKVDYQSAVAVRNVEEQARLLLRIGELELEAQERTMKFIRDCASRDSRQTGELDNHQYPVPLQSSAELGLSAYIPFIDNTVWLEGEERTEVDD